ncbi:MAG: hypothetical protein HY332_22940 [Chloroflexi bacterium]|nr:hypothetical protein [Chloroflexota bacterium]
MDGQPEVLLGTKDDVELYVRTYTTILRSSGDVRVRAFVASHQRMRSSLHSGASLAWTDTGAFIYAIQRLPDVVPHVQRVILGQEGEQFRALLGEEVTYWQRLQAPARRRHWRWDGASTMTAHVASSSDLDDLIPCLVAYQIEWNKLHALLQPIARTQVGGRLLRRAQPTPKQLEALGARLGIDPDDWLRLQAIWGDQFWAHIEWIAEREKDVTVRLLGGHEIGYTRLVRRWWHPIGRALEERSLAGRPLYFILSNMHSVVNLVSGYARRRADMLWQFLEDRTLPGRTAELDELGAQRGRANAENVLYYAARLWHRFHQAEEHRRRRRAEEEERGIAQIEAAAGYEVGAQLIELARLCPEDVDPRLAGFAEVASRSNAVILNVDYPLGLASYQILREVAAEAPSLRGAYSIGKAATLNGAVGDVLVSNVVYDEHSRNTYVFDNAFDYDDVAPFLERGAVLDNQKAVTVRGTFLQNREYLDFYYREQYTVVEMEAGPLLAAVYESSHPTRYPMGQHVAFRDLPFDFGLIHYASDTPYTQARTLGSRSLSFEGIDATYASTVAVLRRIMSLEAARMGIDVPRARMAAA